MSFDVNADIRQAMEDAKKSKTKVRRGKNNDLLQWCPGCMERIYRKVPKCPKCGQRLKWDTIIIK